MNQAAVSPQPCLDKLPLEVLYHILGFLSHEKTKHRDFHNCEVTCKALKAAVGNDLIWRQSGTPEQPYSGDPRIQSHRLHSRISWACRNIKRMQRSASTAIDRVLSREEWNNLLNGLTPSISFLDLRLDIWEPINIAMARDRGVFHEFTVRTDTSDTIKALLDKHMQLKIEQALLLAADVSEWMISDGKYPVLGLEHLLLQDKMEECNKNQDNVTYHGNALDDGNPGGMMLSLEKRDRLVRTLFYRAGVTIFEHDNDAYGFVWVYIVHFLKELFKTACMHLASDVSPCIESRPLEPEHSVFDEGSSTWHHTITPCFIEENAKYSGVLYRSKKVYGPEMYLQEFGLEWSASQTYEEDEEYDVEMDIDTDDDEDSVLSFDDDDEMEE